MHLFRVTFSLFAVALLLVASPAQGQDRPVLKSFFGTKTSQQSKPKTNHIGKRVEIDLSKQRLYAYNGNRLYMKTKISSGRTGNTPTGRFRAGPYKSETHFSSLYHNAPMPWSVQITGNIFIHGFSVVPNYPASKGCVRVPISGINPARKLYRWLDVGTPIRVHY